MVQGVHEFRAKIQTEPRDRLKEIAAPHIHRLENFRSSTTIIVMEDP